MPTILKTKNSVTTTVAPTTLQQGELAVNITDKKMWVGNAATTPVQILGAGTTGTAAGSNTQVQYNSSGTLAGDADFTFNGTTVTMANDASISGLTVGKGRNQVANNTAFGLNALASASLSGDQNVGIGNTSLFSNTTGGALTAIGMYSLAFNTTGNYNTGLGHSALYNNTTASNNTAVGYQAAYSNTGGNNTAVGFQSLKASTTSIAHAAFGSYALSFNTTGAENTGIGAVALYANTTGSYNVAVGKEALTSNTTASNNTAVGYQSLYTNTTGAQLAAFGFRALYLNTTANNNTAFGPYVLYSNTTGTGNTAVGNEITGVGGATLGGNTTGSYNTAMGASALQGNTTGSFTTAIGYQAGYSSNASNNTFIGAGSGFSTTGTGNTFIGNQASGAGGSGYNVTSGTKNTILGNYNGNQGGLDIRTSSNYIVLSDGDGNPRIIVDNNGKVLIGGTSAEPQDNSGVDGIALTNTTGAYAQFAVNNKAVAAFNRLSSDGTIVSLRQAGIEEGTISVSGTTVSYNGGHLSRWSQLPDNSKDDTILKGTVLTNLDDMCVWTKEGTVLENEQLNKMKVSDVEGDTNVAGVFVNWTFDEQCQSDDMNIAMTGDMIIRIADGVVVQKGDLLMSAGDGTAMPQGDDIVRSKTIAKVTSNYVTCTYADGSYCVPCVLMAC